MYKKKVSVIIPTFNRSNYIVTAIESVLSQWQDGLEIIVVDDGSTDDTKNRIKNYVDDKVVRYIYQANSGRPSAARNKGISHADGEYICFLDSDDYLIKGSIEKRLRIFQEQADIAMVSSGWIDLREGSNHPLLEPSWVVSENFLEQIPSDFIEAKDDRHIIFNTSVVNILFTREFVATSSVMIKASVLESVGNFDESLTISEDRDLWLRIISRYKMAYIYEPLTHKRRHTTNITNNSISYNYLQDRQSIESFLRYSNILYGPNKLLARKQLAAFYHRIGMHFWYCNEITTARSLLKKAASVRSANAKTYIYLLCTYLPSHIIKAVRYCKNYRRPDYNISFFSG